MQKSVETARGHPRGGHRHQRIGLNIGIADPDTDQEKGREKGAEDAHHAHEGCDEQRSEEHTSELQSLMRSSYAVFCLKKKTKNKSDTLRDKNTKTSKSTHKRS